MSANALLILLIVLSSAFVLLEGFGLIRTFVKKHKEKKNAPTDNEDCE